MFTGVTSITTNSFGINVDVIHTSVGFLSTRIQCSLAVTLFSNITGGFLREEFGGVGGRGLYDDNTFFLW